MHVQEDMNPHILHLLEGTFLLDMAHLMLKGNGYTCRGGKRSLL